jgi:DNA-binding LacI/PurR family transcriptional regulator
MSGSDDNRVTRSSVDQIVSALEEKIRSGRYEDSYWLPTERALAEEFRVSRTRVREALTELEGRNLVIREAGCRTAIRRELDASAVTPGKVRRSIGLWISNDPPYSGAQMVARGVQRALDTRAYRLILSSPCGKTREEDIRAEAEALTQMAQEEDIAGLILWYNGGSRNLPQLRALHAARIPMVFVDRLPPPEFDADYVGIDNRSAAQEIVEHLLAQGHRRIAHITNAEPVSSVHDRLEGYRQALEAANLPFRSEYVLTGEVQGLVGEALPAEELADQLLALPERPTALFAVTDHLALTLVTALQTRGARVPNDIAVAGFDDLEHWGLRKPFLTTVRQPFERIGKEAVKLLDRRIQGVAKQTYHHRLLDATLIVRESTRGTHLT